MKILINDIIQYSDAPDTLKSPALSDVNRETSFTITLDKSYTINCIGLGNTDATQITINGNAYTITESGLYLIDSITTSTLTVSHNGTFIGRLATGSCSTIGLSPTREIGFYSTENQRSTASGQVVPGAGGVSGRRIDVDIRYKFTRDIFEKIEDAYPSQISKGFPFFILFDKETHRFPWLRLYASTDNNQLYQSTVNRFLYSRRFTFTERF